MSKRTPVDEELTAIGTASRATNGGENGANSQREPDQKEHDVPRALVVDDNEAMLTACARTLVAQGYQVETAPDAESGLRALRCMSFDLMVSDINLPGMSGVDLVAQMRADGLDIPVVLVTGDPQVETAIQAMAHGVLRYLAKPVAARQLAIVVHQVVRLHGLARAERLALDNDALRSLIEELRRSKDAALAGTRAKDEFLSKMGHELRTPMSAVIGMTQLVLDTELTPLQRESLQFVKTSADSLMRMIAQVLDHSALEGGMVQLQAKTFSVRDIVNGAVQQLFPYAQAKSLSLTSEVGSEIPDLLVGDPSRFAQVIDILLSNAIKFTAKGEVRVNAYLEAHSLDSEVRVCTSISDTGMGIEADAMVRILEPFSQADNSSNRLYGGAGLGLTIASQLVALMAGSFKIESTPNVGTNVRLSVCFGRVPTDDGFVMVDSFAGRHPA